MPSTLESLVATVACVLISAGCSTASSNGPGAAGVGDTTEAGASGGDAGDGTGTPGEDGGVGGVGVPPGPAPQHRDALRQPFASTSIWNMPIGASAVYKPANVLAKNLSADDLMPQIDDEQIVLKATAPLTSVGYSDAGWSSKSRCAPTGGELIKVPIPADYIMPSNDANNCASFLMPDGRTILQAQPFTRCKAGGPATSLVSFPAVDLYGDGITGGHGGSNLSGLGGSIRVGELRPAAPAMRHAIKLNVDPRHGFHPCATQKDCFRWPAIKADSGAAGSYGSAGAGQDPGMKMGALLAIPPSTDVTKLTLESEPGKRLAWSLQNYGAYLVDSTGGLPIAFSAENGPDGSVRAEFKKDWGFDLEASIGDDTAWTRDVKRLMDALMLVDNNSAQSIGGGGAPLQPLAPELSQP